MAKKRNYQDVYEDFLSFGCVLLTTEDEYEGTRKPLKYKCECGNKSTITYYRIKNGGRCKDCGKNKNKLLKLTPYNEIENIFNENGYILTSNEKHYNTKSLSYICPEGHKGKIRLDHFKNGVRCSTCIFGNRKLHNHPNWTGLTPISSFLRKYIEDWKSESFKQNDYKCLISGVPANVVHHLYSFNLIVRETLEVLEQSAKDVGEYTEDELNLIINTFLIIHDSYGLGVPLAEDIHREFHKIYGVKDNNKEQFEDFMKYHRENKEIKNAI